MTTRGMLIVLLTYTILIISLFLTSYHRRGIEPEAGYFRNPETHAWEWYDNR